jgi:hypothetical protein
VTATKLWWRAVRKKQEKEGRSGRCAHRGWKESSTGLGTPGTRKKGQTRGGPWRRRSWSCTGFTEEGTLGRGSRRRRCALMSWTRWWSRRVEEGTGGMPATKTYGQKRRRTMTTRTKACRRWERGPGERGSHPEADDDDGGGGGGQRRPETSISSPELGTESASLCSIEGLLLRFLARGGPRRRGGSAELNGGARGGRR